jgi:hypothetical protein
MLKQWCFPSPIFFCHAWADRREKVMKSRKEGVAIALSGSAEVVAVCTTPRLVLPVGNALCFSKLSTSAIVFLTAKAVIRSPGPLDLLSSPGRVWQEHWREVGHGVTCRIEGRAGQRAGGRGYGGRAAEKVMQFTTQFTTPSNTLDSPSDSLKIIFRRGCILGLGSEGQDRGLWEHPALRA